MGLRHVISGWTFIISGAILDMWVALYMSGPEYGIDPGPKFIGPGLISRFCYIIGLLLLCRGMQIDMRESVNS